MSDKKGEQKEKSITTAEREEKASLSKEEKAKAARKKKRVKRVKARMQETAKAQETEKEEPLEAKLEKHRKKKKAWIIGMSVAAAIILVYLGISLFFINHFYFRTKINGVSFSAKTVEDVEAYMKKQVQDYTLTLKEKDGKTEEIKGTSIDLQYKNGKGIEEALKEQHPLLWITAFFGNKNAEAVVEVNYNEEKLNQAVSALECLKEENQTAAVSAQPVYNGEQFEIQEETYGTQINQEVFQDKIHEYVGQFKNELDLEEEECYVLPKYTKDSSEVAAAKDSMNQYLTASITYNVEPNTEVVDKTLISQWLTVDEDMNVTFSTDAVGAYIDELCNKYNTVGKVRTITTPTGKTAQVSGGGYGWKIDRDGEYEALVNNITAGEVVTREPVYAQTAASHSAQDWGTTYLEVDLTTQHMWYIVNGSVALETDVVTGIPVPERVTPQGTYDILEKKKNKTLRGEKRPDGSYEYETPVDYWMRVTWTGIGFHDADWQTAFGGEIYKTRKGSHGCINMPPALAGQLYDMLEVGCPVIIHY